MKSVKDSVDSKIFWFEETKGGNQKLVRPDGTYRIIREKNEYFAEMGPQCHAGWQRAKLLMREYGYWDATAFGCVVDTLIGICTDRYDDGNPVVYIFSSCQKAERSVYPFLSKDKVEICRKNVDDFYNNPNIQAAWHDFILHPVCFRVEQGADEFTPVAIESIGCGQGVLGKYRFSAIWKLDDRKWIEEMNGGRIYDILDSEYSWN